MNRTAEREDTASRDRLPVNEDEAFQHKVWRFERVGWLFLGLVCLAALLGLVGSSPLSRTEAGDADLRIEYARFLRREAPSEILIHVGPAVLRGNGVTLQFNRGFAESYEIESLIPEPEEWRLTDEGVRLRFAADALHAGAIIHLHVKAQGFGRTSTAIGVEDRAPVAMHSFVYP